MLIDASQYEAVVVGLDFVGNKPGHEMDRSLHALVLDLLVLVDKVARIADRSSDTWVGRGLFISQRSASIHFNYDITYAEEIRDPTKLPQSWELPGAPG